MRNRFFQDVLFSSDNKDHKGWFDIIIPSLLLGVSVFLWFISLADMDLDRMQDFGLLTVFPATYYISLILLSISYLILVYRGKLNQTLLSLHIIAIIFIIHGTPQILYGTVRYSWAWKHVGIIDYIQRTAGVNPTITVLDVYHNWPGFFALGTLFTQAMGLGNALMLAGWSPVFFNLLNVGALLLLFKAFSPDKRLIWSAVWIFLLTNWVGQDYFSPQAFSFYLYLIAVGISIHWFKVKSVPSIKRIKRFVLVNRAAVFFHELFKRADLNDHQPIPTRSIQRAGVMLILILVLVVIIPSHQLTPFMLISSLAALVIFQSLQARSLPIFVGVITIVWIIFVARGFFIVELPSILKYIGQLSGNVSNSLVNLSEASQSQRIISYFSRAFTLLVWGLAFTGFIRRWRAGYRDLSAILLAGAPFALLIVSSYGGEIVFRVYLFSLASMAFFTSCAIHPKPGIVEGWRAPLTMVSLTLILMIFFIFTYFGKDHIYHYTKNEVQASEFLYSSAPPGSLLVEGSRNYPSQFLNYENFTYVPIDREPRESRLKIIDQPVVVLSRWLDNDQYSASYIIITRSQKLAIDSAGTLPPGSLDGIEQALLQSPLFELLYSNPDAKIFVLKSGNP